MKKVLALVSLLALVALACDSGSGNSDSSVRADGSDADTSEDTSEEAEGADSGDAADRDDFPVTVAAANGDVEIAQRPERIVSLSPTSTEMLFAVGAGEQVVAVDDQSDFPPEAPVTDLSGFSPNVEAIADLDPDVVFLSDDIDDVVAGLDELAVPVVHQPAAQDLEDTYEQIRQAGVATGHRQAAETLVDEMQAEIEALLDRVPDLAEAPTYYHELDDTLFSVTSNTFIGQVYALAGLENIADAAEDTAGGFPQLSNELVVEADPDLIFLADTQCCDVSAGSIAERPGWSGLSAVENGHVFELDDDVASRWGPRVVDFFERIVEAVESLDEGSVAAASGDGAPAGTAGTAVTSGLRAA